MRRAEWDDVFELVMCGFFGYEKPFLKGRFSETFVFSGFAVQKNTSVLFFEFVKVHVWILQREERELQRGLSHSETMYMKQQCQLQKNEAAKGFGFY